MQKLRLLFNSLVMLFFMTLTMVGFIGCETDANDSSSTSGAVTQKPATRNPPQEITGRMKYVVGQIWWYEAYVTEDPAYRSQQRGKWFQFNADGSFVYGKWQDSIDSGTWSYDDSSETLFLSNPGGTETLEWKTMMSHTNDQMVWLGPPRGQNGGDQTMLRPYLQKPRPEDLPGWRG